VGAAIIPRVAQATTRLDVDERPATDDRRIARHRDTTAAAAANN
jgi:hypothetical protein